MPGFQITHRGGTAPTPSNRGATNPPEVSLDRGPAPTSHGGSSLPRAPLTWNLVSPCQVLGPRAQPPINSGPRVTDAMSKPSEPARGLHINELTWLFLGGHPTH